MAQYRFFVKIDGPWHLQCEIEASTHAHAFSKAMACIKPEHYDKPIRLEQVEDEMSGEAHSSSDM